MRKLVIATITALTLCSMFGAETLDSQMSTLAQTLAAKIKDSGKKKVTVLDFTDLEGKKVTELGRYIAEQLTINLDSSKKEFTIVDRANLKKILDEHKLTVSGLVEPENAKKLGQISGVDALILGTVADLPNSVKVFAKIIATDTADVAGSGECRVTKDDEVKYLLGRGIESGGDTNNESGYGATSGSSGAAAAGEKTKAQDSKAISQRFGDLNVVFESLRALDKQTILVNLIFQNKGDKNAIGVGVYCEAPPPAMGGYVTTGPAIPIPIPLRSTLLGSDGLQFESDGNNLVGIRPIRSDAKDLIEIPAGEEIKTAFKYRTRDRFSAVPPSFRLQAEIVMNSDYWDSSKGERPGYVTPYGSTTWIGSKSPQNELPGNCKIHNLVLDIPVRGK